MEPFFPIDDTMLPEPETEDSCGVIVPGPEDNTDDLDAYVS